METLSIEKKMKRNLRLSAQTHPPTPFIPFVPGTVCNTKKTTTAIPVGYVTKCKGTAVSAVLYGNTTKKHVKSTYKAHISEYKT